MSASNAASFEASLGEAVGEVAADMPSPDLRPYLPIVQSGYHRCRSDGNERGVH
jgi:hypothetical protein